MITKVEAYSPSGDILTLSLLDSDNGYYIKDIPGLDPVNANLVSSSFAQLDGEQYQSARRVKRNIILKLGFDPDYVDTTVSLLRQALYAWFMPKTNVTLLFYRDDGPTVAIQGWVESFTAPSFTADPDATISIINFDPDFYTPDTLSLHKSSTATTTEQQLQYNGTVETGFVFTFQINRPLSAFSIYARHGDTVPGSLDFIGELMDGDILKISTVQGNKYAILTRAGVSQSFLYGVSPYSNWLELFPGRNFIRVYAEGAPIPYVIEYTEKFGGL